MERSLSMSFEKIYGKLKSIYSPRKVQSWHHARGAATYDAASHIAKNKIEGDWVECGVADGKSSMVGALSFLQFNLKHKNLWLYDTYEGNSNQVGGFDRPCEEDGELANDFFEDGRLDKFSISLESVKKPFLQLPYTQEKIKFIEGRVQDTIPQQIPSKICILRLDVDFYEPTKHCLEFLYPLVVDGGYVLIDDYGTWPGCKLAIHEYFNGPPSKSTMKDSTLLSFRKE